VFSAIQTRPRGESSSKLSLQASPFLWEHKARLSMPRRMSLTVSPFDFEFHKKGKEEKPNPFKKPAKLIVPFNKDFVELNPDEEDSSPELKKLKSRNSGMGGELFKNEDVWEMKIESTEDVRDGLEGEEYESLEVSQSEFTKDLFTRLLRLCHDNTNN